MDISFQEKSLWLVFLSLLLIFGVYFLSVLPVESSQVLPHQIGLFLVLIVFLVLSQIVGHIFLAIVHRRSLAQGQLHSDERDRIIHLKGIRNASYVLATGVFVSICLAILTEGNFLFTHTLLAFWVLAQLVEIGTQLVSYRHGV